MIFLTINYSLLQVVTHFKFLNSGIMGNNVTWGLVGFGDMGMCIYTALSPVYKLAAPTNSLAIHFTKSRPTSGIMWSTKQIENNLKKTDLLDFNSDRLRTDFPENNPSECLRTDLRNKNKTTFSNISSQSSISDSLLMENINMLECQVVLEDVFIYLFI